MHTYVVVCVVYKQQSILKLYNDNAKIRVNT